MSNTPSLVDSDQIRALGFERPVAITNLSGRSC